MVRLAANISMMFQEVDLLERFAQAAEVGFGAVEIHAPYDEAKEAVAAAAKRNGVEVVLLNVMPPVAAIPGREGEFREALTRSLDYAQAAGCRQLHCVAGPTGHPDAESAFVANLQWASEQARPRGVRLLLEPLNTRDNPGYFLIGTAQARRIIEKVGSGQVYLQYDVYHMQIMEGFLAETIKANLDLIRHFQIAGVPGRHEPDENQEVNYRYLLSLIDGLGFEGWVGCEYRPRGATVEGLGWARPYGFVRV
ncbi:MAG: TIM barrel protein [Acidobacteria bacterium]|jgi:hydroxypyruvate isomerase|nr:TIM barrel protein [Acidobacteriota bacterium]